MFRRSLVRLMGDGPKRKRYVGPPCIHQADRPPHPADIDFSTLGLQYPLTHPTTFTILAKAWAPPPSQLPNLPFELERTQVGQSLPVYTDYKGSGTKVITILRKCKGDIKTLKAEMQKVVGPKDQVRYMNGKLVVDGNYCRRLKTWLTGLGF